MLWIHRQSDADPQIGDEEIVVRTLYTMVNEAAKILEEGIAQRASDIDVVWAFGYGWPRPKGGPMFWADSLGLATIVGGLERYRDRLGAYFSVAASIQHGRGGWDIRQSGVRKPVGPSRVLAIDPLEGTDR